MSTVPCATLRGAEAPERMARARGPNHDQSALPPRRWFSRRTGDGLEKAIYRFRHAAWIDTARGPFADDRGRFFLTQPWARRSSSRHAAAIRPTPISPGLAARAAPELAARR